MGLVKQAWIEHQEMEPMLEWIEENYGEINEDSGDDWDEAVARVEKHRENEVVFFDKVMFHQLPQLSRMIDEERHSPMCHPFYDYFEGATWVYIRRSNVFEQVVSKYIAEHTSDDETIFV